MHPLLVLYRLQTRALVRRLLGNLRTVKGVLLFLFGVADPTRLHDQDFPGIGHPGQSISPTLPRGHATGWVIYLTSTRPAGPR